MRRQQSSGRNPKTVKDAEQAIFRAVYVGFLSIGVGLIFVITVVLMPVGLALIGIGGLIVLVAAIWSAQASKSGTVAVACPECKKPNSVFREEEHFNCAYCGYLVRRRGAWPS